MYDEYTDEKYMSMHGSIKVCYICGKTFTCFPQWVYKRQRTFKRLLFCTYGCMRKYDKTK